MWFPESANLHMDPTLHLGFAAECFGLVLAGFFLDKSGPETLLQLCNTDAPSLPMGAQGSKPKMAQL